MNEEQVRDIVKQMIAEGDIAFNINCEAEPFSAGVEITLEINLGDEHPRVISKQTVYLDEIIRLSDKSD